MVKTEATCLTRSNERTKIPLPTAVALPQDSPLPTWPVMAKILRITFTGNFPNLQPSKGFCFLHTFFANKLKHFWFYKNTDLRVGSTCLWPAPHVSHSFPFVLVLSFLGNFLPKLSPLQHITVLINPPSNFCSPQITHSQVASTTAVIRKMLG